MANLLRIDKIKNKWYNYIVLDKRVYMILRCPTRSEIERVQLKKLKRTILRMYTCSDSYRIKMKAVGVTPDSIASLKDICKLPFTEKDDLKYSCFSNIIVPRKKIIRFQASSGSMTFPTIIAYTKRDIQVWKKCVERIVQWGGVTSSDIVQICFNYGMFTGAIGLDYGVTSLGAAVIPSSAGNTEMQLSYIAKLGTTTLVATPTYVIRIAEVAKSKGIDLKSSSVRKILVGGELMTDEMRNRIKQNWHKDLLITTNYGLSELMGPGIAGECKFCDGMHVNEDCYYVEIVDPTTGEPLEDGEMGEVVITDLSREGMPLIRYRTHDLSAIDRSQCRCGNPFIRLKNLLGRTDDMMKIRGVKVYPSHIEKIIYSFEEVSPYYQIIVRKKNGLDSLLLNIEVKASEILFDAQIKNDLATRIRKCVKNQLGINVDVVLLSPSTLERTTGKRKIIVTNRHEMVNLL